MTAPDHPTESPPRILVTGASGYVGGRLVPALLNRGYRVRCLARAPRKLEQRDWRGDPGIEVVQGDLSDIEALVDQLRDCTAAYYLIHSTSAADRKSCEAACRLANNFAEAAQQAKLDRIIYLGGLDQTHDAAELPESDRKSVAAALAATGVPVTALRAAMIIGSGSASFEILRYLVERLPLMVTPRWVESETQPVSIADVLEWLVRCLDEPATRDRELQIGGPDIVTYRQLMHEMAAALELPKRWIFGVPVFSPRLSSAWISLITPVTYRVARPLTTTLRRRLVITDNDAREILPHEPLPVRAAIERAVARTRTGNVPTRWTAAGPIPGDPDWAGGKVYLDRRSIQIAAQPDHVFSAVCRIGGGHGWYAGDFLWRIRGWMDQAVGGPGLRRGRRHADDVEFGEALDFWRVVGIERGRSLLLHAEMKLPGTAQLEFLIEPLDDETTELTMTAKFRPKGLLGILYWYAVVPLHGIVFRGMLRGIKQAAEQMAAPSHSPS